MVCRLRRDRANRCSGRNDRVTATRAGGETNAQASQSNGGYNQQRIAFPCVRCQQAGSQNGCTENPHWALHKKITFSGALFEFLRALSQSCQFVNLEPVQRSPQEANGVAATQQSV
jgi:hypothetical protein